MNVDEYNVQVAAGMSEAKLQQLVIGLAKAMGYMCYHTHDSRRSQAGYPDLTLVKPGRLVFVELKSERGRVRPEQLVWLAALDGAGVGAFLFRPSDYLAGKIESVLR